jgi:branched-chain amino acid transport system permease protein
MCFQLVINGILAASVYGFTAIGMGLICRVAGFFNFALAGIYTLAAYMVFFFCFQLEANLGLSILMGCAGAAFVGIVLELGVFRPLRHTGATALALMISSLGLYVILQNTISFVWGDSPLILVSPDSSVNFTVFDAQITGLQALTIVCCCVVASVFYVFGSRTRAGMMLRAVSDDQELAALSGISVQSSRVVAVGIGSSIVALGGILLSLETGLTPSMGFRPFLMGFVAAIVGGIESTIGTLIAALLIGLLQNLMVLAIHSKWQDPFVLVVLLGFLLFRPHGLFGTKVSKEKA